MLLIGSSELHSLLQVLCIPVDSVQFLGNIDALRAMVHTLIAADAMAGLPQAGHAAVVAHEKGPPGLAIVSVL